MSSENLKPLLPLRDIVIFPSIVTPLFVGRKKSIKALEEVMKSDKSIVLVTQKNSEVDDPQSNDIYSFGCLSKVLQLLKLPDGTVKVLVEGLERVKIVELDSENKKYFNCKIDVIASQKEDEDSKAFATSLIKKFEKLSNLSRKDIVEFTKNLKLISNPSKIADNICSNLNIEISEKQHLLEMIDVKKRLEKIYEIIEKETSVITMEKKIRGRVKNQMEKTQREYYLNEQLKAIQKELGEIEDGKDEISNLSKSIAKAKMSKEAQNKCMAELKKLKAMSPMSAEATVVRNYLDWMIDLPWFKKDKVDVDLNNAIKTLDEDRRGNSSKKLS